MMICNVVKLTNIYIFYAFAYNYFWCLKADIGLLVRNLSHYVGGIQIIFLITDCRWCAECGLKNFDLIGLNSSTE